jgi:hypothetical protein
MLGSGSAGARRLVNVKKGKTSARRRVASGRPDSVTIHLLTKLGLAPEDMRVEPGTPQMGRRCPKTSIPSQQEREAQIAGVVGDDAKEQMDFGRPEA